MYNWERDEELKEEARAEERVNTERERKRADDAEKRLKDANERIAKLEAEFAEKK